MNLPDNTTPVVVLNCKLGGLAIMRSLGSVGVTVYGVDADPKSACFISRYCRRKFIKQLNDGKAPDYLDYILRIGEQLRGRAILIPTSDELSVFVAEYAVELGRYFIFPKNDPILVKTLISKEGMYSLAKKHDLPTAETFFPKTIDDVVAYAGDVSFPVMLKGIHGNRLQLRTGKKMVIVHSKDELIENYKLLEDPHLPNLMIQEYIPGGDDYIYIFNGYFNDQSDCLAAFTGHKIRQYPVHVGCASLGVCIWNEKVAKTTTQFMKTIGYKGVLDIGYRWDPRDGQYKVLDINPRVGQAFRLFVANNGMDVVRAMYLDLNGQKVTNGVQREGRRWIIEDYDLESSMDYFREGTLTFGEWVKSFKGVEEGAWFSWKDPLPFLKMCSILTKKGFRWTFKKVGRRKS